MSCKYYCIDETMIIVTKIINKHISLECNFEIATGHFVYMLVLTYFKGCVGTLGGSPLERNVC